MASTVGIVVPAYDPDIPRLVEYVDSLKSAINPVSIRIELDDPMDNFSSTNSLEVDATINVASERRGKGRAISEGFDALDTDILVFVDADGSVPAGSVTKVIAGLSDSSLSVGSRRHPDARIVSHQTLIRRALGNGFAKLAKFALPVGLFDYQCGAKAMSRDVWIEIRDHIEESGFAWDLELIGLASGQGYTIKEIPVTWCDHPGSTVHPVWTTWDLFTTLLKVRERITDMEVKQARKIRTDNQCFRGVDQSTNDCEMPLEKP